MADTLETLEIEVKHHSKDAEHDVKSLASALKELADALKAVKENGKGLESIRKSVKAATGGNSAYSKIRQETSRQTMSDAEFKSWYDDIQKRHQAELAQRAEETLRIQNEGVNDTILSGPYDYKSNANRTRQIQDEMGGFSSGVTDKIREQAEAFSYETTQAELLETRIDALQEKLAVAFGNNDSEKVARYTEQIQKLREKLDGLNNVHTDTISPEVRAQAAAFADSATEADLLRMKMEALQERLATAFNNNDNEKVANYTRQIQRLRDEIDGLGADSEEAVKNEKGLLSRLADSSAGRIVKYRVIRGIIKDVANAAKEGLNNAYMFSKSIGGDMAQSMDSLATSLQTVKNQLGSALGSMLMSLMPIITKVADAVTWLADKVTQLFAALSGKSYYQKATAVPAQWAEDTQNATDALKEWKNQIMGFDEINRLEDTTGTSTSRKTAPDYGSMYEMTEIEDYWKELGNRLKPVIDGITLMFQGLIDFIKGVFTGDWSLAFSGLANIVVGASNVICGALDAIQHVAEGLLDFIDKTFSGFTDWLSEITGIDFSWLSKSFSENIDEIKRQLGLGIAWLKETFKNEARLISDVLNGDWGAAWEDLKAITGQKADQMNVSVWQRISQIFSWINTVIAKIDMLRSGNLLGALGITGSILGFAEGGTPTTGSLFWAGEAGPELVGSIGGQTTVTNTDQFGKAMDNQTNMLLGALNLLNKTVQEKDFDITLDGMSLARGMSPYTAKYAKIQGPTLINGVT